MEVETRSLKVFFPFTNDYTYIAEIEKFSSFHIVSGHFLDDIAAFDIVNIHWPEALFDWKEPSESQLDALENQIAIWKKSAKIVYTKHDYERVKGMTPNFKKLFRLIESNTNLFIHLGDYSKKLYKYKYPDAQHVVIPHPAFQNSFKKFSKGEARKRLGIDDNALVIVAPGQIRSLKERKLVIKSFQKLKIDNKVLVATNMRNELENDFKGRVKLQKVFDVQAYVKEKFIKKYQPPQYYFSYDSMNNDDFALRIAASDIVLVARTNLLNTGNVLLGLTFEKITVGPAIGNIEEQLTEHGFPVFDPKSISSVVKSLEKAIEMFHEGIKPKPLEKHRSENVAREYERIFNDLIS